MSIETIARRYATALADVVIETGESDTVKGELLHWEQQILSNSDLRSAFDSPAIAHQAKDRLLEELLAKTSPSKTTANFLRVLQQNSRLTDLGEINERFAAVLEERSGIVAAEITSARELAETDRGEFRSRLERLTGKKVDLKFRIDSGLIGGVVTRVGSTVYDGSVRTKLENLKEQLVNG